MAALMDAILPMLPAGSQIDVVTTMPNRWSSLLLGAPEAESRPGLSIRRIALPRHQNGMVDKPMAFLTYALAVPRHLEAKEYDIVFATSGQLMTTVLGAWIASKKRARLYLDIRDIFVDTIKDLLPRYTAVVARPFFSVLERWAVNRADKVNLVSQGFAGYFAGRYPGRKFTFFTNGIDDEFRTVGGVVAQDAPRAAGMINVLCAGNIGKGQGLHLIVPELARKMRDRMRFRIIGDGAGKDALRTALSEAGVDNVELLAPVTRDQLIKEYQRADVLFAHLNDHDAFKKVLPSKLFEYAAMGKPIWAGVSGYPAEFVRTEIRNSAVFHPCNVLEAEEVFARLALGDTDRTEFIKKFARASIMQEMAKDIVALADAGKRTDTSLD
jgi:glycosyltransferase involved in cell wall biosynthesis